MSSPTMLQKKENYAQTHAPETEPDVTVRDDVDDSIFSQPSHDEIAVLAYSFWLNDGQRDGSADEHWIRAEQELRSRRAAGSGASETSGAKAAASGASASAATSDSSRASDRSPSRVAQSSRSDSSQK